MNGASSPHAAPDGDVRLRSAVVEQVRILAVAGITVGVIVVGLGSRLAMFVLRLTSPDSVIGVQSDDDFTIGKLTLAGTYNLALLGTSVGIIGVAAYQCVSPRLIGPTWFRRLTVALASGAVVGSMLVHGDGIDFRVLEPTWLAIGLFVLLPAIFGAVIGPVVEAALAARVVARRDKAFAVSDAIRDELVAAGVEVRDTPDGAEWLISPD